MPLAQLPFLVALTAPAGTAGLPAPGLDGTPVAPVPDDDGVRVAIDAGGEAGTAAQAASIGASADATAIGDDDDVSGIHVRGVAATGGAVALRGGGPGALAATHWAHASYDWLPSSFGGTSGGLFALAVEHHLDVGALPALAAPRDVARAAYAREQVGLDAIGATVEWDGRRVDVLDEGGGVAWTWQAGAPRLEVGMHAQVVRYCRGRAAAAPFCVEALGFGAQAGGQALGPAGGGVATLTPLALRGVHLGGALYVDAAGGFGFASGTRPSADGGAVDLPELGGGVYDVGAHARVGAAELDARARRQLYLALDGEVSRDDRVDASVSWSGVRTRVTVRGFAARTTWWTSAADPGATALTGGGEVAVAREDRGFAWDATLGVARSFYATLDGAAADAPALGARGAIEVRRAIVHRGRARAW